MTNELLKEKWDAQKELSKKSNYDIRKYHEYAEKLAREMAKQHNVTLNIVTEVKSAAKAEAK